VFMLVGAIDGVRLSCCAELRKLSKCYIVDFQSSVLSILSLPSISRGITILYYSSIPKRQKIFVDPTAPMLTLLGYTSAVYKPIVLWRSLLMQFFALNPNPISVLPLV
jgi:hypothetical protein